MKNDYATYFEERFKALKRTGDASYNPSRLYKSSLEKVMSCLARHRVQEGRILELGCAMGDLSILLAENGYEVRGIDISETAIELARAKSARLQADVKFLAGSVLDLPYDDESMDVVVDALCFHCIIGDDRAVFLENVHRVLKRNGLFIVMTKCGEPEDPAYPFDPVTRCKIEDGVATRYWGRPADLAGEILARGFSLSDWTVFDEYKQPLFFAEALKA